MIEVGGAMPLYVHACSPSTKRLSWMTPEAKPAHTWCPKSFLTPYLSYFLSLSLPWAKPDISHRLRPMCQYAPGPRAEAILRIFADHYHDDPGQLGSELVLIENSKVPENAHPQR